MSGNQVVPDKMDISVSEVKRGNEIAKVWHIKGWNEDFELLKDNAKCFVDVFEDRGDIGCADARLCFFFKKFVDDKDNEKKEWLSMCVSLLPGGYSVASTSASFKQYFSVSVDKLNRNFKLQENIFERTQVHFVSEADCLLERTIKKDFFLVKYNNNVFTKFTSIVETKREDNFVLRIAVTPLFIDSHSAQTSDAKLSYY